MRLTLAVVLAGCFTAILSPAKDKHKSLDDTAGAGKGLNFYSLEKELALGKEMAQETEKQSRILLDPVVTEYVNRMGQNLARNSDAKVPFQIKVIDSAEVNAFALPGGFMFVNSGLILHTQREAELAGIMSHEIGHVAARHATKQATRATMANYATIPLIFFGGGVGLVVREAASLATPLGLFHFSRAMEREADRLGLAYMYRAGYDPVAFIDFFERIEVLEKTKPGTLSKLFSTHPVTVTRIKRAQEVIQHEMKPLAQYVLDTSEFHQVRDHLIALDAHRESHQGGETPVLLRRSSHQTSDTDAPDSQDEDRPTLRRRK